MWMPMASVPFEQRTVVIVGATLRKCADYADELGLDLAERHLVSTVNHVSGLTIRHEQLRYVPGEPASEEVFQALELAMTGMRQPQ
jgi:hypothetical protein